MKTIYVDGYEVIYEWMGDVFAILNEDDLPDDVLEKAINILTNFKT